MIRYFKTYLFAAFAFLIAFNSGAQLLNNVSMLSGWNETTTPDGKQLVVILSDSEGGTSPAGTYGPTPTAGTVFEWNGTTELEVGATDLTTSNTGSPWPQMGINYNASSGYKPVFVPNVSPGAEFSPNGDNNNWSASGTLRAAAETKINSALEHYKVRRPVVFVVLIGTNDVRASTTLATVQSDVNSFFTWVTTTYPDTPVICAQVGVTDINNETARATTIRGYIKSAAVNNTNVHMFCNLGIMDRFDGLHFEQASNNMIGAMAARWLLNDDYSKWARAIIASQSTDISTARKDLISDWVGDATEYLATDVFFKWKNDSEIDNYSDWCFTTYAVKVSTVTFNAGASWSTVGTGYIKTCYIPNSVLNATQDDIYVGVGLVSYSGTGALFGVRNPSTTAEISLQVSATPTRTFRINDVTATSIAGGYTAGSGYYVERNGTTKILTQNTTQLSSTTVASTATISLQPFVFSRNNNDTSDLFSTSAISYYVHGKRSVMGSNFNAKTSTLISGW